MSVAVIDDSPQHAATAAAAAAGDDDDDADDDDVLYDESFLTLRSVGAETHTTVRRRNTTEPKIP